MRWLQDDAEFREKYTHARELQACYKEHQAVQIAMSATPETAQVARLQYDALRWQMSKLHPKVYGEKPAETHVSTSITNNAFIVTADQQRELQERRLEALKGRA